MSDVQSICVYCGASGKVAEFYKTAARTLGREIGHRGMTLVYGGGRVGLMGLVADAALDAGAPVVGIIPEHIQILEIEHTGLTELHIVDSMHTRKRMMVERSDAFVVLPGGFGTLDETFEALTLIQTGRMARVPFLMFGREFWEGIINWTGLAEAGTISEEDLGLFRYVETAEEAVEIIDGWPKPA